MQTFEVVIIFIYKLAQLVNELRINIWTHLADN